MGNFARRSQRPQTFGSVGSYGKSRDQRNAEEGKVWCIKHPGTWYDPKKFKMCYHCWMEYRKRKDAKGVKHNGRK